MTRLDSLRLGSLRQGSLRLGSLRLDSERPPDDDGGLGRELAELVRGKGPRIRCPRCAWEPRAEDLWSCLCGHEWNTFDTGGVCPGCGHRWLDTMCLACARWSPHRDWYEDPDGR